MEGYVNFGIPGVIVTMFLIGMSYRIIQGMFEVSKDSGGSIVVLAFVYLGLCDIEGNYSQKFGGVPASLIFVWLIGLWVVVWEREAALKTSEESQVGACAVVVA